MTIGFNAGLSFGVGQPVQYPNVNGFAYSWASVEVRPQILSAGGIVPLPIMVAAQSIDYEPSNNAKEIRGANPNPLATTRGEIENTGKMKLLLLDLNNFLTALGDADPTGNNAYGDLFFNVTVTYAEAGSPIITDTLTGCRVYKVTQTGAVGPDAIMSEIDMRPILILRNGQPMSSAVLSAPQP